MQPYNIRSINSLPEGERKAIYARLVPTELIDRFHLSPTFIDPNGNNLVELNCLASGSSTEMKLKHTYDFPDPILYGHITDTINGQIHVLLYTLIDPTQPRFDVDRLPDGTETVFGIKHRNIPAELDAMQNGLAPGQIRKGLRLLGSAIRSFENFVESLGQEMYFAEPLFYHNAVIFEKYGFTYAKGKKLMESIQADFKEGNQLSQKLDSSTPFRQAAAIRSIRLRSWAIHDGLLGEPFTNATMYKYVGKSFGVNTSQDCPW